MKEKDYVQAIQFVLEKHRGQKRIGGRPYIVHPLAVGLLVSSLTDDYYTISAAFLHDVLEDTNTTEDEIKNIFGNTVLTFVKEVTNMPKIEVDDGRVEYYIKKMSFMSPEALLIKLADRLNNVSDLNRAYEPFKSNYSAETIAILNGISSIEMEQVHRHLIDKIFDQVRKAK